MRHWCAMLQWSNGGRFAVRELWERWRRKTHDGSSSRSFSAIAINNLQNAFAAALIAACLAPTDAHNPTHPDGRPLKITFGEMREMGLRGKGRDPAGFNRSLHFIAEIEEYARSITSTDLDLLPGLTLPDREL